MANTNFALIGQGNLNVSDHDATSAAAANSGLNATVGLVAVNAGNPAVATSGAVNLSPVTQANAALVGQTNIDPDGIDIG